MKQKLRASVAGVTPDRHRSVPRASLTYRGTLMYLYMVLPIYLDMSHNIKQ